MDVLAGFGFAMPLTFLTVVAQFAVSRRLLKRILGMLDIDADLTVDLLLLLQVPPALMGTATSITLSARSLGGGVGVAVVSSILNSNTGEKIPAYVAQAVLPMGANPQQLGVIIGAATGNEQLIGAIMQGQIPGVTPPIFYAAANAVAEAFADSYRLAWIPVIAFSALGIASVLLLKRNKNQFDYVIDAPLQHVHHSHAKDSQKV